MVKVEKEISRFRGMVHAYAVQCKAMGRCPLVFQNVLEDLDQAQTAPKEERDRLVASAVRELQGVAHNAVPRQIRWGLTELGREAARLGSR